MLNNDPELRKQILKLLSDGSSRCSWVITTKLFPIEGPGLEFYYTAYSVIDNVMRGLQNEHYVECVLKGSTIEWRLFTYKTLWLKFLDRNDYER